MLHYAFKLINLGSVCRSVKKLSKITKMSKITQNVRFFLKNVNAKKVSTNVEISKIYQKYAQQIQLRRPALYMKHFKTKETIEIITVTKTSLLLQCQE